MWQLAIASSMISAYGYQQQAKAAKMEGQLAARNIEQPVSYTHLTLPTTPYV